MFKFHTECKIYLSKLDTANKLSYRLDLDKLEGIYSRNLTKESTGVTKELIKRLQEIKKMETSPPRIKPTELIHRRANDAVPQSPDGYKAEALLSFNLVSQGILERKIGRDVMMLIADNLKPVVPFSNPNSEQLESVKNKRIFSEPRELEREAEIIKEILPLEGKLGNAVLTINESHVYRERSGGGSDVSITQQMMLQVPISGTADIAKRHNLSRSSITVDESGSLRLVFIFVHGRWLWQPFGW